MTPEQAQAILEIKMAASFWEAVWLMSLGWLFGFCCGVAYVRMVLK